MMRTTLLLSVVLVLFPSAARAQQVVFVPTCNGTDDTARFTSLINIIGSNVSTIELPFKNGSRCAVNNLTIPANITLDNVVGTGIKVNSGQTLTVLGPIMNPVGKVMFFGPGTTTFVGNAFIGSNGQALVSNGAGGTSFATISGGGGGGGAVESFAGRTGVVLPATGDYTWNMVNKATSSIADITLRSADLLSNGTTGTGQVVLADSPTMISPVLGVATVTSINGLTITPTTGTFTLGAGKTLVVSNSLTLTGTSDDLTLTVPATGTVVLTSRTITEGPGLAGNTYDLSANRTLAMGTPSTLSVSSLTSVSGTTHSHAITSSANPGAAASLLATDASGFLQVQRLGIATVPTQPLEVGGNVFINAATANLFLKDTSTGWQSASTTVITPQANNAVRSPNYTSRLLGWTVNAQGDAEFNNVDVRGAIRASVFTFNQVNSTAGTLGVFKSAGRLLNDVVVPSGPTYGTTTVSIDIEDPDGVAHGSGQLFATSDILRLKDGLIGDTWLRVTAISDQTTFWRYTAAIMAGSNNVTYRAGMGVADYGQTGQGFIIQTADQVNSPYLQMATHPGTFTSLDLAGTLNVTPQLRLGNLNGSYGYSTNIFGYATGQYGEASKAWLTVEQTNGIRIGNNTTTLGQWTLAGEIISGQVSAGQSNVFISAGSVQLRNNTTPRIQLDATGAGFVANSLFSWDIAGNVNIAGNAVIAGWAINNNRMSNGTTHIASSFDVPVAPYAWFGKAAAGYRGVWLADSGNRFLALLTDGGLSPRIVLNDGTRNLVVIGDLNQTWGADGATNSMGMKIWDSSGNLLVHLSSLQTTISNWTIATNRISAGAGSTTVGMDATVTGGDDVRFFAGNATPSSAPFRVTEAGALTATNATITGAITATSGSFAGSLSAATGTFAGSLSAATGTFTGDLTGTSMSLTGKLTMSGASSAITIGTTPPTNATTGSGLWIDRTGLYALASSVLQAKIDASTGAITAGAGNVILNSSGYRLVSAASKQPENSFKIYDSTNTTLVASLYYHQSSNTTVLLSEPQTSIGNKLLLQADSTGASIATVWLRTSNGGTTKEQIEMADGFGTKITGTGVQVGAPTGGAKGSGSINVAADIYKNNTAYTNPDYVFEHWATGAVLKHADKPGALAYSGLMPLEDLKAFTRATLHLPRFGPNAEHGLFSGGDSLLASLEEAYLYIFQLEERIKKLEALEERLQKLERQLERNPTP
jgi:hypothetical protein